MKLWLKKSEPPSRGPLPYRCDTRSTTASKSCCLRYTSRSCSWRRKRTPSRRPVGEGSVLSSANLSRVPYTSVEESRMNFVEARDDTACSDQESQDSPFSTFPCETSEKRLPAKTTQSGDRELTSSSKSSPLRGMRKERREKRLFSLCEETSSDRKKTLCPLLRKTLDQRLGKLIVCSNIDNLHIASSLRIPSLSHSRRKAHTDTTPTPPPHRTPGDHPAQPRRLRRPFLVVAGRARFRPFSGCSKDKRFRRLKKRSSRSSVEAFSLKAWCFRAY